MENERQSKQAGWGRQAKASTQMRVNSKCLSSLIVCVYSKTQIQYDIIYEMPISTDLGYIRNSIYILCKCPSFVFSSECEYS